MNEVKCRRSFEIGDGRYATLKNSSCFDVAYDGPPTLVTVIFVPRNTILSVDAVREILERYRADDVFRDEFLSGVLLTSIESEAQIDSDAETLFRELGMRWFGKKYAASVERLPPSGPYFLSGVELFEVFRLYDDPNGVFIHTFAPIPESEPSQFLIRGRYPESVCVAVPSRIRDQEFREKALSGLRIAVKDNFHFKGLRTSVCNKAYYELYDPPTRTAECIEALREQGAVIVGTTKLASFAATEEPVECIDFQAPWNPRGDGYQSPAGSSSGSGAAIAAYPWLDISIGTDTSGSGRRPAHWNGCFAMRPTHGVLSLEGLVPSFPRFDTPTIFGRDLAKCRDFATHWYGKALSSQNAQLPPAIIYSTDYMSMIYENQEQLDVVDRFVADLEDALSVKREDVSFNELWDASPPPEAEGIGLQEYMRDVGRNSFFHDDYHNFDKFRTDYRHKFSRDPYVSPPIRWQWELSSKITQTERDVAVDRLEVYKRWFLQKVMRADKRNSLVLIPIEKISPRYRDDFPLRPFNPVGVPNLFLSPILGAPELTVPIGHCSFKSKVTGNKEKLPIAISMIASPGRDLELFDIAHECLTRANRPTEVLTGREMF